jgi:hypothetical protein
MAYFSSFPVIWYDSFGNGNSQVVTNLLRRVGMRTKIKSNKLFFDTYDVKEGETPEMLADKLYGDVELHWVILMINDITDRYHQWPLTTPQFLAFIKDKYSNVDAVHHYEITQTSGDTTLKIDIGTDNTDYPGATAITNFEYEESQEDVKRKIRLLVPQYVPAFISEFNRHMQESSI